MRRSPRVLCFSVALNGYQFLYQRNIRNHRRYCSRHGYDYVSVTRPLVTKLGRDSVWLKVSLIREALLSGYDWIVCLDVDTEVKSHTPAFHLLYQPNKSVYLAEGFSGRFNSGVMFFSNSTASLSFVEELLASAHHSLEDVNRVGWGENGHLIQLAKDNPHVVTISSRWNNNQEPLLDDYIRHFSRGPLYHLYQTNMVNRILFRMVQCWVSRIQYRYEEDEKPPLFQEQLSSLTEVVIKRHPEFDKTSLFNRAANLDQLICNGMSISVNACSGVSELS